MATVLVIDDVPVFRDVVQHALAAAGHVVLTANNGAEGLKRLESDKVDLVLLDLAMPEMDGVSFLRRLRADKQFDALPVLVVTALSESSQVREARQMGALGPLLKSRFSLRDLLKSVSTILPPASAA
ncbi:MAG TPA: response regulator [Tepidisphaeraceae bacterium]|nr:response regulator [Tepidisphaeraceae bacterium]